MPGGGANHITGEGILTDPRPRSRVICARSVQFWYIDGRCAAQASPEVLAEVLALDRSCWRALVDARQERDATVPEVARVVDAAVPHLHVHVLEPHGHVVVVYVECALPYRGGAS
eukprot:766111-Prorocentrum_minimum.AAC.1